MIANADTTRFEEMMLLIARASERDSWFGAIKLNKLLFYADFRAFWKLGRSISGQTYQKLQLGPAPRQALPVLERMVQAGSCAWAKRDVGVYQQRRLLALREPNVEVFSAEEVQLIHQVIDDLRDLNGAEVSDLSHRFIGWRAAEIGEDIPYETVFIGEPQPFTPEEEEWALEAIDEYLASEAAQAS